MTKMISLLGALILAAPMAQALVGHSGSYSTALIIEKNMTCEADALREVKTVQNEVLATLCSKQYRDCLFHGSCVVEKQDGSRIGINFHKQDELKERSYFVSVDMKTCPYGYGSGKLTAERAGNTCLIPYKTIAADVLEYNLGDIIYVPSMVGLKLPNGGTHDGYLIVGDSSTLSTGAGKGFFDLFAGHDEYPGVNNPVFNAGFGDSDKSFKYEVVRGEKAARVLRASGFKVVKSYKHKFKAPNNPMLGK